MSGIKRVDKTVERLTVSDDALPHSRLLSTLIHFIHPPRPSAQDRARIVFDCRMVNDPAMIN